MCMVLLPKSDWGLTGECESRQVTLIYQRFHTRFDMRVFDALWWDVEHEIIAYVADATPRQRLSVLIP